MIVVRPEDSPSQRELLVDPELFYPPIGSSESRAYETMILTRNFQVAVTE